MPCNLASCIAATHIRLPIGSVELEAVHENGEPYEIHGCNYCLPWHAEVRVDDDGHIFVREWHAVECEAFEELISSNDSPRVN